LEDNPGRSGTIEALLSAINGHWMRKSPIKKVI
jgi:hypothetical protein